MKNRSSQEGQVFAYSAICMLAFFSLAAVAVDAGRHVLVGRETQAVADAMALAGATALGRGGDAYQAAIGIAARDRVDGTAPKVTMADVTVGNYDLRNTPPFTPGGFPSNAARATPEFTINNIFGLWSATSQISRLAVAAFAPAPPLPIALCGYYGGATKDWSSGVRITFKVSNQTETANTAGWAVYAPGQTTASISAVATYLPTACGGSMQPPEEVVGGSLLFINGVGNPFNNACATQPTGLMQCLTDPTCAVAPCPATPRNTFMVPITDAVCGAPMNQQQVIIGFVTMAVDAVGCDSGSPVCGAAGGPCIIGHVATGCTAANVAACPVPGLVQ